MKGAPDSSQHRSIEMLGTLVPGGTADVPAIYLATLLQEIQIVFKAPDTLAELSDGGQMSMWLHADGRLTNPQAVDTMLSADLVRALATAMDSTSRLGGIGPVFPTLGADSVPLRLVIHFADRRTPFSVPLLRFSLPVYSVFEVEKPALAKRNSPAPRYPDGLRQAGIEGEVLAQFIVNQAGRVETRSFRVLKSSHEDFVIAVREVLPRLRFSPAEVRGCPAKQLIEVPFAFKLNW